MLTRTKPNRVSVFLAPFLLLGLTTTVTTILQANSPSFTREGGFVIQIGLQPLGLISFILQLRI